MGKSARQTPVKAVPGRFTPSANSAPSPGAASAGNPPDDLESKRLDSRKEISSYLGREIRTCYRWAIELGLPVRRIDGRSARSRVFAFRDELDNWLRNRNLYGVPKTTEPGSQRGGDSPCGAPIARSRGKGKEAPED